VIGFAMLATPETQWLQALSHHNKPSNVTIGVMTLPKLKAVSACQPKTLMLWSF
jgi:hypothetical protein